MSDLESFLRQRAEAGQLAVIYDEGTDGPFPHTLGRDFIEECGDGVLDCGHRDGRTHVWVESLLGHTRCFPCARADWQRSPATCRYCRGGDQGLIPLWVGIPSPDGIFPDVVAVRFSCRRCDFPDLIRRP